MARCQPPQPSYHPEKQPSPAQAAHLTGQPTWQPSPPNGPAHLAQTSHHQDHTAHPTQHGHYTWQPTHLTAQPTQPSPPTRGVGVVEAGVAGGGNDIIQLVGCRARRVGGGALWLDTRVRDGRGGRGTHHLAGSAQTQQPSSGLTWQTEVGNVLKGAIGVLDVYLVVLLRGVGACGEVVPATTGGSSSSSRSSQQQPAAHLRLLVAQQQAIVPQHSSTKSQRESPSAPA